MKYELLLRENIKICWSLAQDRFGYRQKDLASVSGNTQPFISRVLSGHERPTHSFICGLGLLAGVSPIAIDPMLLDPRRFNSSSILSEARYDG